MASDNRISLQITPAQKTAIDAAIAALKTAMDGLLINLTPEEKQSLPRIGDKSLAFDEKCAGYMAIRADLVPSFLDLAEVASDRELGSTLLPCLRELSPLVGGLEDTTCWRIPTTWWPILRSIKTSNRQPNEASPGQGRSTTICSRSNMRSVFGERGMSIP